MFLMIYKTFKIWTKANKELIFSNMEELKTNVDVQNKICEFCFDNLQNIHESKDLLSYPEDLPDIELALFVTWKFEGMLRGWIGTFKEDLISKILPIYSYLAAFEDSRFPPILPKEIPHLSWSVSFLSDFEPIDDPLDWEVGKHGIEIEFTVDEKNYRGIKLFTFKLFLNNCDF